MAKPNVKKADVQEIVDLIETPETEEKTPEQLKAEIKALREQLKSAKPTPKPRYTRQQSSVQAIFNLGEKAKIDALVAEAEKLYTGKGGKSNLNEAKAVQNTALRFLRYYRETGYKVSKKADSGHA